MDATTPAAMAAPNIPIARPPIDAVDWDSLARLMNIPDDRRRPFVWALQATIKSEWEFAAGPSEKPARHCRRDADIAKTGRAFIRALERRVAPTMPERIIRMLVGDFLDEHVRTPLRGAPNRTGRFASLLWDLLRFVYMFGGRATFNRRTGRGNVIELMDELRPIMPVGLMPSELPMPLIERVATKVRGAMADLPDPFFAQMIAARAAEGPLPLEPGVDRGTSCPQ